ncbi:MAG: shikimate kinase [Actinomycetota bacterium]|jgi:shikimate kinase|nr:shikimate kinase [Actinomycetota bacterium]
MAPLLVLIGSPGAGKSSVGRRVAERLGVRFVDTDHVIEDAAGTSISDIFVTEGEEHFRRLEAQAVAETLASSDGVVALGGGAVMRPETQELLAGQTVVWLKVAVPDAASRVGLNTARPLLLGNVRGTLSALLDERNPVYASLATLVVDTSGRTLREVTEAVMEGIGHE